LTAFATTPPPSIEFAATLAVDLNWELAPLANYLAATDTVIKLLIYWVMKRIPKP
jgi:hypothetical protein